MNLDPYKHRLQTKTKHHILKRYLQTLSFKVLSVYDELAYIDGFSGPWKSETEDFSDTSFKIALNVLADVQEKMAQRGLHKKIRCFFVEENSKACAQLQTAVAGFHRPEHGFEVAVRHCEFEDAIGDIKAFVGNSFTLTFIDPTGWTGYRYDKIKPLLCHQPGEVVINFMFDHVNRFREHPDEKIITSMDGIFGGAGWASKLDRARPGPSLVELFREALRDAGSFQWVLATPIEKSTEDRPHFYLVYGTRHDKGLEAFRAVEHEALGAHDTARSEAKAQKKEVATGIRDLFAGIENDNHLPDQAADFDAEMVAARNWILDRLRADGCMTFRRLWPPVLDRFRLKTTHVRKILTGLAREGVVENTWTRNNRRVPQDADVIQLSITEATAE